MKEHTDEFKKMFAAANGDEVATEEAEARVLVQKSDISFDEALKIVRNSKSGDAGGHGNFETHDTPKSNRQTEWEREQDEINERRHGTNGLPIKKGLDNPSGDNKS